MAASAATTFIGWLMARRALRPVAVLTAGAMAQSRVFSRRAGDEKDRDELDRLALTFNEMLATLRNAYEAQKRFIAAASHELRAPLSIINANLEFLGQEHLMRPIERTQTIAEARAQALRMARLVADLLVLARADAGMPLARQAVELDRVLLEVVGELRHVVKGQRLEIESFQPVTVQGDADRLKQLVLILIDNAIKYTAATQHVTINLRQENAIAELIVRDTGVGMSSRDLLRAFERFYRADDARALDAGGTGLGLPIARLIAEEHGGTVKLTSELGRGTTATVRIPVSGRAAK
jgi:signal transduction histidine kinase